LESGVINAREIARARWLVLFRSEGKGVDVNTSVGVTGVVLVRLDEVEVGTFTLGESVLAVKLELSGDNGILTPAVHVEGALGQDKGAGIGHTGGGKGVSSTLGEGRSPVAGGGDIDGSRVVEETRARHEVSGNGFVLSTEGHDGVREGINAVSVVKGLGTERAEEGGSAGKGRAVVNIGIRLDNKDQLLAGVVKVELDLVGGRTDGFITSELKLFDEVFVGVLGHTATLISVQEHVVNIERGGDEGLVVGRGHALADGIRAGELTNGPQALINRADVKVDLDFVVLKSDEGEGKSGVSAVPELEGNIEGSFGESIAGLAHLDGGRGSAGTINRRERGVSDEGKLGSVTDHLVVTALLLLGERELIPQVHPVTILAINALTTDFNFNLGDHLLTREVEPAGPHTSIGRVLHRLVDFRESDLQVGAVSQITIATDGASDPATKIGLSVKGLFDGFHRKVGVATVSHLPEGNLRVTGKVNILCAVSYELH